MLSLDIMLEARNLLVLHKASMSLTDLLLSFVMKVIIRMQNSVKIKVIIVAMNKLYNI